VVVFSRMETIGSGCVSVQRAPEMPAPQYAAQVGSIIFLTRIGSTLRWATSDIVDEELPPEVRLLLRRLDRLEAKGISEARLVWAHRPQQQRLIPRRSNWPSPCNRAC
jgi:hypothetical protein